MPLTPDDQIKYKSLYLQSARQYIAELQTNFEKLRSGDESIEVVEELHRIAHSMKGQSLMMEYPMMSESSMLLEHIFLAKKENKLAMSQETIAKLDEAIKAMNECLESLDKENKEKDMSSIIENLRFLAHISE